jgi:hypothetical protein
MPSHWPFGHLQPKLWAKEGPGVKLAVWLPTTKSREWTSSQRRLEEYDTALESSWRELQLWFRTCPNPSSGRGVMAVQSSGSPAGTISGLHFGSPNKMCHLDVASATSRKEYYRGVRWWLTPEFGPWWVLCVQVPVANSNTQGCPEC